MDTTTIFPWQSDKKQFLESGSYRFTDAQRESYALYLDIRIVSYVVYPYESLKTLPPNGFWGYATVFQGSVIRDKVSVDFV